MASTVPAAQAPAAAMPWGNTEPHCDAQSFYCIHLKADLLPGTFVLFDSQDDAAGGDDNTVSNCPAGGLVVARVISVMAESPSAVTVNIFKRLNEVTGQGILHPPVLQENHLRHLQEIVQTAELRIVNPRIIVNLCFVFTLHSLTDTSTLAFTCQGMALAFLLRFRLNDSGGGLFLSEVPHGCCLPFPSSYQVCMSNGFCAGVS
jgi:hypothetical protein